MAPLSEAQRGIVSTIREFVRRDVNPVAQQMEHDDEYPSELVERMKELGLFGAIILKNTVAWRWTSAPTLWPSRKSAGVG